MEHPYRKRTPRRSLIAALAVAVVAAVAFLAPGSASALPIDFTDEGTLVAVLAGTGGGFVTTDDGLLSCSRAGGVNTPSPCSQF